MEAPVKLEDIWRKAWPPEYYRERENPGFRDVWYIQNSDLKRALEAHRSDRAIRVLDYGCGGSPYRFLFPNARFERADVALNAGVDYLIRPDQGCDAPEGAFDLVLSTQVAEHVARPQAYFSEIFRLVKPGGKAVITTHGTSEDHGLPFDFQRWTAEGLRRDLESSGFSGVRMARVTTNLRALLFAGICLLRWVPPLPDRAARLPVRALTHAVFRTLPLINRLADRYLWQQRVVDEAEPNQMFYLILLAAAVKPAGTAP